ncbi:MAG: ATP-dependent chaperone ClpB [Bacteroidia bacterium]|nr:ATP-dependent chaperone ClpB [Bacteroidia bacterium]
MNLNNFTLKSQEAIENAQQLALEKGNPAIECGHILKGILNVDANVAPFILKKMNVNIPIFTQALDKILESYPKGSSNAAQYLSSDANKAVLTATSYLKEFKDEYVSIEHLLLGLLNSGDVIARLMKDNGITTQDMRKAIDELRKGKTVNSQSQESQYNALNKYAIDLNAMGLSGKLDPVIGRDEEIRRLLQILSRRTKNNPILVGEPGVGKTAIVEGLAQRMVNGDIPENLKNKKIFSLDMSSIIAGAKYKGEFEERLKALVKEVTDNEDVILFIDEIHTLVGAGGGEGAMDAANILKPALSKGLLRAIGATTLNEYQKYFEKDKALERRFQMILVDEPDEQASISILRGIKEKYESHHKVRIKDEAIVAAVELSERYISQRFLPDKAIDLIDEAAAKLRLEINSVPVELDEIERKIRQIEIEREAIKRENDKNRLSVLNHEISELSDKRSDLMAQWKSEKEVVDQIHSIKQAVEEMKHEADQAERASDFGKVAELRYGKIKEAESKLAELEKKWDAIKAKGSQMLKEEVDREDIAAVVSRWTGIPLKSMMQTEREKLLRIEDELHKRVIGQEEAVQAVADAIRRSRAGLQDSKKPIGSFIFLGTTGVGKTEVARALAEYLFNSENNMVRIDMSEYQEKHSISKLIGAPPGYVGFEEGGQLTEAVRHKPYSVLLLDEIEKAHYDVFNLLLQVLDDGRLTDSKGRVVNFKNTIIIMTSNIGSDIIQEGFEDIEKLGKEKVYERSKTRVMDLLRKTLRPEFLNRIDEIIMFSPLNKDDIISIVNLQFNAVVEKLKHENISLSATDEALNWLAHYNYDQSYGARPIKRLIQKQVLNELSKEILAGKIARNSQIVMDVFDNKVVFRKPIDADKKKTKTK